MSEVAMSYEEAQKAIQEEAWKLSSDLPRHYRAPVIRSRLAAQGLLEPCMKALAEAHKEDFQQFLAERRAQKCFERTANILKKATD